MGSRQSEPHSQRPGLGHKGAVLLCLNQVSPELISLEVQPLIHAQSEAINSDALYHPRVGPQAPVTENLIHEQHRYLRYKFLQAKAQDWNALQLYKWGRRREKGERTCSKARTAQKGRWAEALSSDPSARDCSVSGSPLNGPPLRGSTRNNQGHVLPPDLRLHLSSLSEPQLVSMHHFSTFSTTRHWTPWDRDLFYTLDFLAPCIVLSTDYKINKY